MKAKIRKILALALTALVIVSAFAAAPFTASAAESRTEFAGAVGGRTGDCTWKLDGTELTISGNGKMGNDSPWGREITKVIIKNGVTSIGNSTFRFCSELTSVIIGNSVSNIGDSAFSGCIHLKTVTIPDSVNSIGGGTFSNCIRLSSVTIPDSVISIGGAAFFNCTDLKNITISDNVMSIGSYAFDNTAWYNNQSDGLVYIGKFAYKYKGEMNENTSIVIQTGIKGIVGSAFENCTGLSSITIPDSVTSIGESAFEKCTYLTNIDIPNNVTSIGSGAFYRCTGLSNITIPDSVTNIRGYAFDDTAWFNNQPDGLIYAGKVAYKYKGIMPENTSVIIMDGTKAISEYAFFYCRGLISVTIPNSVMSIGKEAFNECTGLTSVAIPNSVTSISSYTFSGCKGLTSVTIPDSVTTIGDSAFKNCTSLLSITIGSSVTSIGYGAFENCTSLTSVTIPDSVISIGDQTFYECTSMKNITIPNSVTSIGFEALGCYFNNCGLTISGFIIYGYENSQAQEYAKDYGIKFVKLVTKSDESTGITLDTPEEMSVSATLLTGEAAADAVIGLSDGYSAKAAYNIEVSKNGEVVQPENIIKVMIPCENKNVRVFRKEVDGTLTDMKAVWANGYLVFYTDHFSVYIVAEEQTVKIGDTNGDDKIDINDVTVIQRCMAEYIELTAELEAVADVNGDNKVDINDATHLQKYLAEFQGVVLGKQ